MPTILKVNGFRFFFFSSDRDEPPHIHVKKGSGDGKIWIYPKIKQEYLIDFNKQEEKQIIKVVTQNRGMFLKKWNEYFS